MFKTTLTKLGLFVTYLSMSYAKETSKKVLKSNLIENPKDSIKKSTRLNK